MSICLIPTLLLSLSMIGPAQDPSSLPLRDSQTTTDVMCIKYEFIEPGPPATRRRGIPIFDAPYVFGELLLDPEEGRFVYRIWDWQRRETMEVDRALIAAAGFDGEAYWWTTFPRVAEYQARVPLTRARVNATTWSTDWEDIAARPLLPGAPRLPRLDPFFSNAPLHLLLWVLEIDDLDRSAIDDAMQESPFAAYMDPQVLNQDAESQFFSINRSRHFKRTAALGDPSAVDRTNWILITTIDPFSDPLDFVQDHPKSRDGSLSMFTWAVELDDDSASSIVRVFAQGTSGFGPLMTPFPPYFIMQRVPNRVAVRVDEFNVQYYSEHLNEIDEYEP